MVYGYARVSTKSQAKDGHGLEQQEQEILLRYDNAEVLKESYTATTTDRPVFKSVISLLQPNDILVVTKLDRLARNTVEGIQIVKELFERNISIHVLNVGLLENTSMGKFFLTTLLAVAEMERNTIIERTQAGKAIAKTKEGFTEGRPKEYTQEQLDHAIGLLESNSYTQVERMTKISKSTLIREKKRLKLAE